MHLPLHLRQVPRKGQWIEICSLSVVLVGLGHWIVPQDPYLIHISFPWIWLAPVLLALRYGLWAGLLSGGIILGGWWLETQLGLLADSAMPKAYVVGGILLVVICGEFGSRWNLKLKQTDEQYEYMTERYDETAHAYHVLGMSHHQLEQSLASRPLTLREVLLQLRDIMGEGTESLSPKAGGWFLNLLAQYFQLEVASVYLPDDSGLESSPLASIGTPQPLEVGDPLIFHAMTTGELCHVLTKDPSHPLSTRYLLAAPAKSSDGTIDLWLVVERMRFLNYHEENFHMLRVFLSYVADSARAMTLAKPILAQFPDCPLSFAKELPRLIRLHRELGMVSRVVVLLFQNSQMADDLVEHSKRTTRGLDVVWDISSSEAKGLCVLLPFSDDLVVEGYVARLRRRLKERWGMSFEEAGIHVTVRGLNHANASDFLVNLLPQRHDHERGPVSSGDI